MGEDFARKAGSPAADEERYVRGRGSRFTGLRFRLAGGVPRSVSGRVIAGAVVLAGLVGFTAVIWEARSLLLHDPRLLIAASSSIQTTGNSHLTRPQLLSVFGEDVDRNILTVSLGERRAELEQLPWVEHATVMRLLPNRIRVAVVERTPVAFVRQGSHIGLVDRNGVLLDMGADSESTGVRERYSFPVVSGISADDPLSTRAARMALFERFLTDLDAGKDKVSATLSEVDLSSPEDVKALIPSGSSDILVHFGDDDFLTRYLRYEERLPEWKTQYPKLASVDMRYEHDVVLQMAAGAAVPVTGDDAARAAAAEAMKTPAAKAVPLKGRGVVVPAKPKPKVKAKVPVVTAKPKVPAPHLSTAFDVPSKGKAVRR